MSKTVTGYQAEGSFHERLKSAKPGSERKRIYAEYLASPEWGRTRVNALDRAGNRCQLCNAKKALQVHHRTYERVGMEADSDLTVLCRACHSKFHGKQPNEKRKVPKSAVAPVKKLSSESQSGRLLIFLRLVAEEPRYTKQVYPLVNFSKAQVNACAGVLNNQGRIERGTPKEPWRISAKGRKFLESF